MEEQLARSPGAGTVGRRIRVRTNFFEVDSFPRGIITHYDVSITPEVPPRLNRRVFNKFFEEYRNSDLADTRPIYDGRKNMFITKTLYNSRTYDINIDEVRGPVTSRRAPRDFVLKLKKVGEINMADLDYFINANGRRTDSCSTAIMVLDILVSYKTSIIYPTLRGSFFTSRDARHIYGGLEVYQGYYQSVRPTRGKMMINVDLSATAFYQSGPLIEVVTRILLKRSPDDLRRGIQDREMTKVEKILKGVQIRDNHRGEHKRRFKIMKFTSGPASHTQFDRGDGSTVSVENYFYEVYNRRLNFPHLPCVVVKKDVFLPMEVCDIIEGQRYMRKLDEKQTSDMIKFTCVNPGTRANKINQGVNDLINYRNDENLRQFGMRVLNEMAVVNARVLEAPLLQYHPTSRDASFVPREGQWNLRDKKLATGATLGSWSVLAFGSERDLPTDAIKAFIRELINTCQQTGMNIPNRNPPIQHASVQRVEESLKQVWLQAGNTAKAQPQLILCILPNTGTPLYAEVKRVCDTVIGVSSQCIQSKHMMAAKKQYCANVCLKMNVKLGGMNAFLNPTNIQFVTDRPTILMGADVTHPRPGSSGPSIAALCASMDAKASRYAASIRVQESRTEIIADLANMVKEVLKTFYQTCGRKPERVLFYRDGVSESQFQHVVRDEVAAVRVACRALEADYRPSITFIVVQKRHHTRFFPMSRDESDRSGNCLPGTVVDTEITHPFEFDFYLQSHAGIQGTSRPTHYHVLLDENGFNANQLQSLSYNLCYLYARCTRSVSLVPPVYYANLVCIRARFHSPNWNDSESSEGTAGSASAFGVVKPELQRVMYYM